MKIIEALRTSICDGSKEDWEYLDKLIKKHKLESNIYDIISRSIYDLKNLVKDDQLIIFNNIMATVLMDIGDNFLATIADYIRENFDKKEYNVEAMADLFIEYTFDVYTDYKNSYIDDRLDDYIGRRVSKKLIEEMLEDLFLYSLEDFKK